MIRSSAGEGVTVGDAVRAQVDPHLTFSTYFYLQSLEAGCLMVEVLTPPERIRGHRDYAQGESDGLSPNPRCRTCVP